MLSIGPSERLLDGSEIARPPLSIAIQRSGSQPLDPHPGQFDRFHASAVPAQQRIRSPKANGFANSLLNASNVSQDRIESAYLRVFGRRPTDDEVAKCTAFIDRYVQSLEAEGVPIDRREVEAWSSLVRALFAANEFFYVD